MDLHYQREVTVGGLVLLGIILFIFGTMWLSGRSFGAGQHLPIRFTEIGSLKTGSPVTVSGVAVGRVEDITLRSLNDVLVTVGLDDKVEPKADAQATIVSVGLVGDVAIVLDPGTGATLPPGTPITGTMEAGLSALAEKLGERADTVLQGAQSFLNQQTADDMRAMINSLRRLADVMATQLPASTSQANRTLASMQQLSDQLTETLGSPGLRNTLERTDSLTMSVNQMTQQFERTGASLDSLLSAINRGQGTLGKLATDTTFYTELRDMTSSMRELLNSIKADPGKLTVQFKVF
jgi:phospholipid/cholesterol/gamma-HCH transport system substrate-binding protein